MRYISDHSISGDENIDAGETINLGIELSNSGLTNANGVNATLSCQDNNITITNNNSAFGNIAVGSSGWSQNDFVFTVAPTLDEDKTVTFNLEIHDTDGNVFNDNLLLEIKSPVLQQSNKMIKSTSNGDLIVEAGETVHFDMDLFNNSRSTLQDVMAVLSSQSPYVENILQSAGTYGNMASYETKTNANEYSFKVSANYPGEPEPIVFSLDVTNNFGQQWHFDFDLLDKPDISDIAIDFRGKLTSITLFWTVYDNILGYNIYRSNTIDGVYEKLNTQILPIAYFEDNGLEQLTTYYYKVSAVSLTGNESNLSQPKKAWTSLAYHPDWLPITVSNEDHGDFWGAPNVYDLDNDGKKEIFITSGRGDHGGNMGTVFGFREDGEELYDIDQNPTTVSGFAKIGISMTCSPAIGDIDNDGIDEIVVVTRMGEPDGADKHKILVYKNEDTNGDGKPDLMWEKQIAYKNFNGVVLSDLNDDGMLEIIVPNQFGNKLEIFDYQGNNYPGWPVTTNENPIDKKAVSMPVAVDLDNDGNKEIVIGYEGGIYIWNNDGTDYLGQNPINLNIPSGGRLDCPVIAADIDNDGYYEILFMSIRNKTGYIYAIKSNGNLVTGWDNDNHSIELSIQSQTWAWPPSFVCGDVDMDGNIEVVIADKNRVKVWDNAGNLILDKNIPMLQCQYLQPLIADVNGTDNECEIVIPSNNGVIHAFKLNGDPVLGWPLYLGSTASVPLITDIDNDSKNEIVAASGSNIYVWDTKGYSYKNQWGSFRLNSYNNAVYENICNYNNTPLVVDNNETWNSVRRINSDVIVDNATLTINSLISFVADAKIIVKPGAKLILDGATLTNACSGPWQGIQVWGDKNHSQYPDANGNYYQGYLELKNKAVIENAIIAVDLWKPEDWASTGGIIYADGAVFRNNVKAVRALYYRNYNPYDPSQEWDYSSNFKNCTFEITQDYPGTETFYKHVDLSHVRGIDFQACDFSVDENVNGVDTYNSAIAGYDAQFRVSALCASQIDPCPEEDLEKCTFTGFYRAVSALNDGGSPVTFSVNNAEFINNAYGVKTRSMNNATVLFSGFEIGELWGCGAGINSDNVTGFAFEENNFSKYAGGPQANYFGIIINNSKDVNEVYKNNFNGLSYANFSDGINWLWKDVDGDGNPEEDDRYKGLAYYCNQNSNNYADFFVSDNRPSGIQSFQGSENHPAGNTFTQNGATWHFYNGGEHLVQYFYNQNNNAEIPGYPYKVHQVAITALNDENGCPSHYGNDTRIVLTASQKTDAEQTYYDNLSDYNSVKTLYDSYIDGGSTADEKLDIETAQPDDMWALRAQLLGDSPHLSFDVLKEAADKTDVFTESALFDILAANPDELRKDTLISYLENKEQPLPDYMIDLLKQLAEGTTYKTALQEQMSEYKHNYTLAALDIVRSILNDTVANDTLLRNWLDNLGGINYDRQIIASYVNEDNFTDAFTLANMLPQLYDMDSSELTEHNYYIDLLTLYDTLYSQGRNTYQMDSTEKSLVENIAANSNDVAGSDAKSILEAVDDEHYPDCPNVTGTDSYKQGAVINSETLGKIYGLDISLKPNPARQWAAFDYTLPETETTGTITITNANGVVVKTLQVSGHQGQKLVDTRKLPSGMYLYTIKSGGYTKTGKMVITR